MKVRRVPIDLVTGQADLDYDDVREAIHQGGTLLVVLSDDAPERPSWTAATEAELAAVRPQPAVPSAPGWRQKLQDAKLLPESTVDDRVRKLLAVLLALADREG